MDIAAKRKVSPRAPTLALDEAVSRVAKIYKAEGRHGTPIDVAYKHIGYSSKNGAAVQALASLGYWGLIERERDGIVTVSKAFEDFQFTPDELHKQSVLAAFLCKPPMFAALLEKYRDRLPSDATIKYDLIQQGFLSSSADSYLTVFKRSVEFARYFEWRERNLSEQESDASSAVLSQVAPKVSLVSETKIDTPHPVAGALSDLDGGSKVGAVTKAEPTISAEVDRIPIRLAGGRKAWLEIPMPFFTADKERLKKHIDLLITDDED